MSRVRSSTKSQRTLVALCLPWLTCGLAACRASDAESGKIRQGTGEQEGPNFFESEPLANPGAPMQAQNVPDFVSGEPPAGSSGAITVDEACVKDRRTATLVRQPVDIIFVLDNSGSMDDELQAVEDNINVNFASILINSQVDYRVILISRHRKDPRDHDEEASTSVCVTTPLSSLASCDSADEPSFSPRFFQYSTKVDSDDSFDVLLDTYMPPFDEDRDYDEAPDGWSVWLRPGAKKVFLEVTDADEDMPVEAFLEALMTMAPEHFGTDPQKPDFVFHSIVGLAEKVPPTAPYLPDEPLEEENKCTGNSGDVTSVGTTYQEMSRLTGGLRFPLCQFDGFDVVFQRIAEDVVQRRSIACDFDIPEPPPGLLLDLNNVAIAYTPGNGADIIQFGQAPTVADCQADAFFIQGDRVNLCPAACSVISDDAFADVQVLFTCESQLIVPR